MTKWYVRQAEHMGEDDRNTDRVFPDFEAARIWTLNQTVVYASQGCEVNDRSDGSPRDPDFRYVSVNSPRGEAWGHRDCDGYALTQLVTFYFYPEADYRTGDYAVLLGDDGEMIPPVE